MISGGGRTVLNLLDAIERRELNAAIPLVIASGPCTGVERLRARGLNVVVEPGTVPAPRLGSLLREHTIDWVVLAGYLKLVDIPPAYARRVINIHPALLPKFGGKGMHGERVHAAVLAAGERESGCTVHFCDARYDTGDVILQLRCPVMPDDTPETLAARVFELEKIAYPRALRRLISGNAEAE